MKEKVRLILSSAVFLALSGFCWTVSIRTAGLPMDAAASRETKTVSESETVPESLPALLENVYLDAESRAALLYALAGAGTPFFDTPSDLSGEELAAAAIWYRMEMGEMPAPESGRVFLSESEVRNDILSLFGRRDVSFSEADFEGEMVSYDPERALFSLPAAAITPKLYARIENDSGDTLISALYPPEGWEGDVLGNRYLPSPAAYGLLSFTGGTLSWKAG